jgi:hypothetical protein
MHSVIKIPGRSEDLTLPKRPEGFVLGQTIRWRDQGGSPRVEGRIRSGTFQGYLNDGRLKVYVLERGYFHESKQQAGERCVLEQEIQNLGRQLLSVPTSDKYMDQIMTLDYEILWRQRKRRSLFKENTKVRIHSTLLAIRPDQIIDKTNSNSERSKFTSRPSKLRQAWKKAGTHLHGRLRRERGAEDPALEEALAALAMDRYSTVSILKPHRVPRLDSDGHVWRKRDRRIGSSGHETGPKYKVVDKSVEEAE